MNATLQTEIRDFIGDDPAQAVERVQTDRIFLARRLLERANGDNVFVKLVHSPQESMFLDRFGLAAYGAGLAAVMGFDLTDLALRRADSAELELSTGNTLEIVLGYAATADAETRIAAMLWAAAWIVEVNENE